MSTERSSTQNRSSRKALARASPIAPCSIFFSQAGVSSIGIAQSLPSTVIRTRFRGRLLAEILNCGGKSPEWIVELFLFLHSNYRTVARDPGPGESLIRHDWRILSKDARRQK